MHRCGGWQTDTTTWEKRLIFTCTAPALEGPWTALEPALRATPEDDEYAQSRAAEGLITQRETDAHPLHAEVPTPPLISLHRVTSPIHRLISRSRYTTSRRSAAAR